MKELKPLTNRKDCYGVRKIVQQGHLVVARSEVALEELGILSSIEGWSAQFLCSLEVAVPVFSVSARLCYFIDSENILIKFSAAFCGDRHKNLLLWKALFRVCINCMVYL